MDLKTFLRIVHTMHLKVKFKKRYRLKSICIKTKAIYTKEPLKLSSRSILESKLINMLILSNFTKGVLVEPGKYDLEEHDYKPVLLLPFQMY
jgi:hypothetical protein